MQRLPDGTLTYSATDLVGYLACLYLTNLEREAVEGKRQRPERDDPELDIVERRGQEHEARHLEKLRDQGKTIVEIASQPGTREGLIQAREETLKALRSGADVIYQGLFFWEGFRGQADFLLRVEKPSEFGPFSYEVADTKLARRVKGYALLQLCAYSEQLARLQGTEPAFMHVILGDGTQHAYPLRDYAAYHRMVRRSFQQALSEQLPTYPEPVEHCKVCRWLEECEQKRRDDDYLSLVANIRRDQIHKLQTRDIDTVVELAGSSGQDRPQKMGAPTFERLRRQARLQVKQRESGEPVYELLPPDDVGRGLGALPQPSAGDLFFDMEGDPWVDDEGLEYLRPFGSRHGGASSIRPQALLGRLLSIAGRAESRATGVG